MPTKPISTQAEAHFLATQTPVPKTMPSLTPGGSIEFDVHEETEARRLRRIAFIENRLSQSSHQMRRDHKKAIGR